MMMKSEELNILETNNALMMVPGMSSLMPKGMAKPASEVNLGSSRAPSLQVEDTNKMVDGILGGFLSESLPGKPLASSSTDDAEEPKVELAGDAEDSSKEEEKDEVEEALDMIKAARAILKSHGLTEAAQHCRSAIKAGR